MMRTSAKRLKEGTSVEHEVQHSLPSFTRAMSRYVLRAGEPGAASLDMRVLIAGEKNS